MLMHQATARGAQVQYGANVDEVLYDSNGRASGVRYTDASTRTTHEVAAKWVVDASGRSALVGKQQQWMTRDPMLRNKMAVWTYFRGCPRSKGIDGGATVVAFIKNKGWFWFIPLENDITSVGVVAESSHLMRDGIRGLDNVFWREAHNNKWLLHVLSTATPVSEFKSTTDYSMQSQHAAAPGVVLVGDALAFLDPVFSSGVLLALKGGVMVGDVLCEALVSNNLDASVFDVYHQRMHQGIENMRKLIHAFYSINISFKDIMQQHPWAVDKITDCLSGDLEQDYADLWSIMI
jgi:flavin-dependent dehydrogenase